MLLRVFSVLARLRCHLAHKAHNGRKLSPDCVIGIVSLAEITHPGGAINPSRADAQFPQQIGVAAWRMLKEPFAQPEIGFAPALLVSRFNPACLLFPGSLDRPLATPEHHRHFPIARS
jgi:hypothetical protein